MAALRASPLPAQPRAPDGGHGRFEHARRSDRPVVPVGFVADRAWRLSTLDRVTIPEPSARVRIAAGEPMEAARTGAPAAFGEVVRGRLLALERRAAIELESTRSG